MEFENLKRALEENDEKNVVDITSLLYERAISDKKYSIACEILIARAFFLAANEDYDEAEKCFETCLKTLKSKINSFEYDRSLIYYARLLLKEGKGHTARDVLTQAASSGLVKSEPLLAFDFYLVKTEILTIDRANYGGREEDLIKNLESFLNQYDRVESIYGKNYTIVKILGKYSPVDMLLELLIEKNDGESFLYWLEWAKSRDLCDALPVDFSPWINLCDDSFQEIYKSEMKFRETVESYLEYLNGLMEAGDKKVSSDYGGGSDSSLSVKEYTNEGFARKAAHDLKIYDVYKKDAQTYCIVAPHNNCFRGLACNIKSQSHLDLDGSSAILDLYQSEEKFYGALITFNQIVPLSIDWPVDEAAKMIEKYSQACGLSLAGGKSDDGEILGVSKKNDKDVGLEQLDLSGNIYDYIFRDIENLLEDKENLIICPDGYLLILPFQSLWDRIKFLEEKYRLTIYPCLEAALVQSRRQYLGMVSASESPTQPFSLIKTLFDSLKDESSEDLSKNKCGYLKSRILFPDEFDYLDGGGSQDIFLLLKELKKSKKSVIGVVLSYKYFPAEPLLFYKKMKRLIYYTFYLGFSYVVIGDLLEKVKGGVTLAGGKTTEPPSNANKAGKEPLRYQNMGKIEAWSDVFKGFVFGEALLPASSDLQREDTGDSLGVFFAGDAKILTPPMVVKDYLFFGGEDGFFYCLNGKSGDVIWRLKTGDWVREPAAFDEDMLYLGGMDKQIRAISCFDGKEKWRFETSGWIIGSPRIKKDKIFALSRDSVIYVLDKLSGEKLEGIKLDFRPSSPLWVSDKGLITSDSKGTLISFTYGSHKILWEKSFAEGKITAGYIYREFFIFANEKGRVASVKLDSGKVKWSRHLQSGANFLVVDGDEHVFTMGKDGVLLALNPLSGEVQWKYEDVSEDLYEPAIQMDLLWVHNRSGEVVALSKNSGKTILQSPLNCVWAKYMAFANESLYIVDDKGRLFRRYFSGSDEESGFDSLSLSSENRDKLTSFLLAYHDLIREIDPEKSKKEKPEDEDLEESDILEVYRASSNIITTLQIIDGVLVFGGDDRKVYGINPENMQVLWEMELEGRLEVSPASHKGLLVVVDSRGKFYVIGAREGRLLWSRQVLRYFTSSPCVSNGRIFLGSGDGGFYCLGMDKGEIVWEVSLGGSIKSTPLFAGNALYVANTDGKVVKINPESGRVLWNFNAFDRIEYDMILEGNNLLVVSSEGTIYCIDAGEGKLKWKYYYSNNKFSGPPLVLKNYLCIGVEKGEILAVEINKGNLIQSRKLPASLATPLTLFGTHILAGTVDGTISAWNINTGKYEILKKVKGPLWSTMLRYRHNILLIDGAKSVRKLQMRTLEISAPAPKRRNSETASGDKSVSMEKSVSTAEKMGKFGRFAKDYDGVDESKLSETVETEESSESAGSLRVLIYLVSLISFFMVIFSRVSNRENLFGLSLVIFIISLFFAVIDYLQNENRKMQRLVNRFVPQKLLKGFEGAHKSEEKEVTVLFQDLYNYSTISELLTPDELYLLLEQIDTLVNQVVSDNNGEIMSYIGDAQMIVFNAGRDVENHAYQAVKTAVEINRRVQNMGNIFKKKIGKEFPFKLRMGFGINTGRALIGVRGGSNRLEPFVIGDTTNIAVRLQKLTREVDCDMLIGAYTHNYLNGNFKTRDLGFFELKGKKNPIRVYGIVG